MQWLLDNWILVLFGVGMLAMHLFGHGHGGHSGKKAGGALVDAEGDSAQTTGLNSDTGGPVVKVAGNRDP